MRVPSLVRELRSHMQCGAVRERKKLKKLTQKAKCYVRLFVRNVQNKQTSKDRKGLGGRGGGIGVVNGYRASFCSDGTVLEPGDGCNGRTAL